MDVFRKQRIRQIEQQLAAGPAWDNTDGLVFTDELGHHLKHDLIYRHLKRIFAQMGVPGLRFHDLRHPYVKPKTKKYENFLENAGGTLSKLTDGLS